MSVLLIFCLLFFLCVRIIGFGVSIDFFLHKKELRFMLFSFGWGFWIVANLFGILFIIFGEYNSDLLIVLNVFFATIGAIFYVWGFFDYFISALNKLMKVLIPITTILIIFLYFLKYILLIVSICNAMLNILIISTFVIPLIKINKLKKSMGKSITWYYATVLLFLSYFPVTIISYMLGYGYGLYNVDIPILIMLNYIPTISATVLLIILLIHIEYNSSASQKFELKDKYSHNLGNILQTISSIFELMSNEAFSETELIEMKKLLMNKINEASELLKDIREI